MQWVMIKGLPADQACCRYQQALQEADTSLRLLLAREDVGLAKAPQDNTKPSDGDAA